jgi:hypothetical protein|tara:strand:+ start:100 stop:390 length:291 start_codon:yes stop_codon:yes gene_type:complete
LVKLPKFTTTIETGIRFDVFALTHSTSIYFFCFVASWSLRRPERIKLCKFTTKTQIGIRFDVFALPHSPNNTWRPKAFAPVPRHDFYQKHPATVCA